MGLAGFTKPEQPSDPAIFAGFRSGGSLAGEGSFGYYWSSSLNTDSPGIAWFFYFYSDAYSMNHISRYYGQSVRAVRVGSQN